MSLRAYFVCNQHSAHSERTNPRGCGCVTGVCTHWRIKRARNTVIFARFDAIKRPCCSVLTSPFLLCSPRTIFPIGRTEPHVRVLKYRTKRPFLTGANVDYYCRGKATFGGFAGGRGSMTYDAIILLFRFRRNFV